MAYSNDPKNPNRSTSKTGSTKKPKKTSSKPKASKPAAPLYGWDGGAKVHTIPQGIHEQNVGAAKYGIDLNAPASLPITLRQAYGLAEQAAASEYAPQIRAAGQIGTNAQPWFNDYIGKVTAQQAAAQAASQPILDQANAWASAPAQAAPGLDPNSAAGQQSQQASQSGSGLAKLGADVLASIATSANDYMTGLKSNAQAQVPVAQRYAAQQVAGLQGDQAAATAKYYGQNRTDAVNADIAYGTLGLNTQKAQDDATQTAAAATQDAKDKKAARVVSRKNTRDRVAAQVDKSTAADAERARKEQETADKARAKEQKKKKADIEKATGKIRNRITDVIDYRQTDIGAETDDTSSPVKDALGKPTGKYNPRKVTQADIDKEKVSKYGTLGRIAIAVRDGVPLTKEQIAYLKQRDPNFRIPREWIKAKPTIGYGDQGGGT